YAGTVIQLVGLTCIFHAYGCLAGLGIYLLAVWWRIEDEEKFLLRALPGEYSQYRAQVPSVLPRFRTSL
ncbi:MAG TPA: hypothetical protein VE621_02605, partial [Bryobacteraceae bacterium]|nr:hypothetical protein [Bryobacteraceae bacterium]